MKTIGNPRDWVYGQSLGGECAWCGKEVAPATEIYFNEALLMHPDCFGAAKAALRASKASDE